MWQFKIAAVCLSIPHHTSRAYVLSNTQLWDTMTAMRLNTATPDH